jgi:ActR/RegA family two-component response regulator
MASVLLIDLDAKQSAELANFLRFRRYVVTVSHSASEGIKEWYANGTGYDVVAVNMSRNWPEDWKALEQIRRFLQLRTASTRIVCFSTAYWGPRMKLSIEKQGGRLVYLQ